MSRTKGIRPAAAIEALNELKDSLGWQIIMDTIDNDSMAAITEFGENPNMPLEEIHFRRGKINASGQFARIPETLIHFFTNEHALEQAQADRQTNK